MSVPEEFKTPPRHDGKQEPSSPLGQSPLFKHEADSELNLFRPSSYIEIREYDHPDQGHSAHDIYYLQPHPMVIHEVEEEESDTNRTLTHEQPHYQRFGIEDDEEIEAESYDTKRSKAGHSSMDERGDNSLALNRRQNSQ